jgi:hypothetical protein
MSKCLTTIVDVNNPEINYYLWQHYQEKYAETVMNVFKDLRRNINRSVNTGSGDGKMDVTSTSKALVTANWRFQFCLILNLEYCSQ